MIILSTPKYTVLLTNERTIKLFDFKIEKFDRLKKYLVNELKN